MTVFISHSSRDGDGVGTLVEHIQAANEGVWLDKKLSGGQAWWDEITSQIRSCTVFVFALSNNSRTSKPCQAELGYAKALGLPILPVQIGDTDRYLIDPMFTDVIDYRTPNAQSSIKLVTALRAKAAERAELPDPPPEPPPVPYEYLQRLGVTIESPEALNHTEQARIIMELRSSMDSEADRSVVQDIRHLLRTLRRRPDATFATVSEIDKLLTDSEKPAPAPSPPAAAETTAAIPQHLAAMPPTQPLSPPSQPSMPSWSPSPPPSQPSMPSWSPSPPAASGRGKWIALGVGGIALVAIVGLIIWLVLRPSGGGSSTASSTSTSSSTSSTSSSTSSTAVSSSEQQFLNTLADKDITWPSGKDEQVVKMGYAVCTDWQNGATLDTEVSDLKSVGLGWSDYQIGFFIGAATGAFCPQYESKLKP